MNQAIHPQYLRCEFPPVLRDTLVSLLGDTRVSSVPGVLEHHGKDESSLPYALPDLVVFPHTTEEVSQIVIAASRYRIPVIPYGTGTSLEGHILAIHGGICIDLSQMNQVLSVHNEDMDATVQAGVTRKQLNTHIKDTGLFFPIDPGADASIGGMSATRASGTAAVRYGTMKENVLALTVVLADGSIIKTGRRTRKSAAGYDLTRLMVGSEGTLGIITEVTVRLYPVPESIAAAVCRFPSMRAAADAVIQIIQMGIPIARCDFVDPLCMRAINRHSHTSWAEAPTVFFEFHGTSRAVEEQAGQVQEITHALGAADFAWATQPEDRSRLWHARHNAYFACLQLQPGCRIISTDVCVPISRLADCLDETEKDIIASGRLVPVLGHIGDGNFHLCIIVDPSSPADIAEGEAINHRLVQRALAMEGTCTGEHGIGMGKIDFLRSEHSTGVAVMQSIKRALDPLNILNPGKILSM